MWGRTYWDCISDQTKPRYVITYLVFHQIILTRCPISTNCPLINEYSMNCFQASLSSTEVELSKSEDTMYALNVGFRRFGYIYFFLREGLNVCTFYFVACSLQITVLFQIICYLDILFGITERNSLEREYGQNAMSIKLKLFFRSSIN